jgi:outer membrane lipoprotein-sorting protein
MNSILLLLFFLIPNLFPQTCEEILLKNYQSRGGEEKLSGIRNFRLEGKMVNPMINLELPIELIFNNPNKIRLETNFQGTKIINLFDGEKCWKIIAEEEEDVQELSNNDAEELKNLVIAMFPLFNYKNKGYKLEYLGNEKVKDAPAYKIRLYNEKDDDIFLFIDPNTGLEVKTTRYFKGDNIVEIFHSEYKQMNGLMVPSQLEAKTNGETSLIIKCDKIDFDIKPNDTLFRVPSVGSNN